MPHAPAPAALVEVLLLAPAAWARPCQDIGRDDLEQLAKEAEADAALGKKAREQKLTLEDDWDTGSGQSRDELPSPKALDIVPARNPTPIMVEGPVVPRNPRRLRQKFRGPIEGY